MATRNANLQASASSLANFKNWATWISGCFSAFGWTQTSDTGQVNWSTIASVPTYGTTVYEVWKMADTLQSTTPCFVKVYYCNSNYTGPLFYFDIGGASDGAGNITGTKTSFLNPQTYPVNSQCCTDQGANTYACWASGDANRISINMWQSYGAGSCVFTIERSHNSAGADTGEFLTCAWGNQNGYGYAVHLLGTLIGNQVQGPYPLPSFTIGMSSGSFNGTVSANPIWPFIGQVHNPLLGMLCCQAADIAEGAQVTVTHYGASHTYQATKQNNIISCMTRTNNVAGGLLCRYE